MRILVVDDDPAVLRSLEHALRRDGYDVLVAGDGATALAEHARSAPDAVVLDVMMPEPNGLEICRRLREAGDETPVLLLTARDLVSDRVAGLDAGADDYLVKPFALEELRARVRALLRRAGAGTPEVLAFGDLELDVAACRVTRGGDVITLTRTELALLDLFLRNPRRVLSRTQILDAVWGYDFGGEANALWVAVSYLRGKLEAGGRPRVIQTVRGLGYVLREEP